ncbi:hypothetical protein RI367_003610 [Sorochytrium milnesiophthora]
MATTLCAVETLSHSANHQLSTPALLIGLWGSFVASAAQGSVDPVRTLLSLPASPVATPLQLLDPIDAVQLLTTHILASHLAALFAKIQTLPDLLAFDNFSVEHCVHQESEDDDANDVPLALATLRTLMRIECIRSADDIVRWMASAKLTMNRHRVLQMVARTVRFFIVLKRQHPTATVWWPQLGDKLDPRCSIWRSRSNSTPVGTHPLRMQPLPVTGGTASVPNAARLKLLLQNADTLQAGVLLYNNTRPSSLLDPGSRHSIDSFTATQRSRHLAAPSPSSDSFSSTSVPSSTSSSWSSLPSPVMGQQQRQPLSLLTVPSPRPPPEHSHVLFAVCPGLVIEDTAAMCGSLDHVVVAPTVFAWSPAPPRPTSASSSSYSSHIPPSPSLTPLSPYTRPRNVSQWSDALFSSDFAQSVLQVEYNGRKINAVVAVDVESSQAAADGSQQKNLLARKPAAEHLVEQLTPPLPRRHLGGGGDSEAGDAHPQRDVVYHELPTLDRRSYMTHYKGYVMRLRAYLEAYRPDLVAAFEVCSTWFLREILDRFEDCRMFTTRSLDPQGIL